MPHHHETKGMVRMPGSKVAATSPSEKVFPIGSRAIETTEIQKVEIGRGEGTDELFNTSFEFINRNSVTGSTFQFQRPSCDMDRNKIDINSTKYESSLFSSSFSEIFNKKLRFPLNDSLFHKPVNTVVASCDEDAEPFKSVKESEIQNIGNFLPDEDDLLSGMIDELGFTSNVNNGDDIEDVDIFSSGGGLELEGQEISDTTGRIPTGTSQAASNGSAIAEHSSRTLLVSNISSSVEDAELRSLFEEFGDIRTLFTACKHQGFVMISYYDIRAARNAITALQNKPLRQTKLDIKYSMSKDNPSKNDIYQGTIGIFNLDSSVSNDDIHEIFGFHGEIKEIRDTPNRHHKSIEFYDVRAAEKALHALNRKEIAGKQIKLEAGKPVGERCLMQKVCSDLEQGGSSISQSYDANSSNCMASKTPGVIISHFPDNHSSQGLHSANQVPVDPYFENALSHGSLSVPNTLQFPIRRVTVGNKYGLSEPRNPLEQLKFGGQCIASSYVHSLSDCQNNSILDNSLCTDEDLGSNHHAKKTVGDNRCISTMASNGLPIELNGGVQGFGNLSCSPSGHHCKWRNASPYQHRLPRSLNWPNSPTFVNDIHARRPPQLTGFPVAPTHMMNMVSPVHQCHIGSAPAVNPSIWDSRQAYAGDSPKAASGFRLGSRGGLGFSIGSPLLPPEIVPRNIFSHGNVNCINISPNAGLHAQQNMCNIFPGTSPIMPIPTSYDSSSERVKSFSQRRNEVASNYSDKKQYELDIGRILHGEDSRTTLMLKNIPNKYTSKMLLAAIDEHHRGTYNFIYLPIDFKNKCNVGYAFINMIDPLQIVPFHQTFNGKKWEKFNSEKVATLAYARIQGKAALISHFQNSSLMNEDKRCRPILFHTDGPNAGDQEPFPIGSHIRSRPGKPRNFGNENHYQGNTSSPNGDESSNGTDSTVDSTG